MVWDQRSTLTQSKLGGATVTRADGKSLTSYEVTDFVLPCETGVMYQGSDTDDECGAALFTNLNVNAQTVDCATPDMLYNKLPVGLEGYHRAVDKERQ